MKRLIICFLTVFAIFTCFPTCGTIELKLKPEYEGVDREVKPFIDEYIKLASDRGIYFDKIVTIGFKDISEDGVMAQCYYGLGFREIDVDREYWKGMTEIEKYAVIFHEASHCYCDRGHDYSDGIPYPTVKEMDNAPIIIDNKLPGHYLDACPYSIMYPRIVFDSCMNLHYNEYIEEMFQRCKKW